MTASVFFAGRSMTDVVVHVTESLVVVPADRRMSVGTRVLVRLSLGELQPVDLEAHMVSRTTSREGEGMATLAWVFASDEEREALQAALTGGARPGAARPGDLDSAPAQPRYRVLLVEDNAIIRETVVFGARRSLGRKGVAPLIDTARSVDEAWHQLEHNCYDLLVVDYYLPDGHGDTIVRRIRETDGAARPAVVAISVGGAEAQRALLDAGADVFFDKPVGVRDLVNTIQLFASGELGADEAQA